ECALTVLPTVIPRRRINISHADAYALATLLLHKSRFQPQTKQITAYGMILPPFPDTMRLKNHFTAAKTGLEGAIKKEMNTPYVAELYDKMTNMDPHFVFVGCGPLQNAHLEEPTTV